MQQRFFDWGTDIIGNSPEEFAAKHRDEREKWAEIAKDAGIKPE